MYLADRWAVALGQRGCYFALPTMATSNQMFSRVKEFLEHRYPGDLVNLQLLHGHASLSAEFQALRQRADCLFAPAHMEEGEGDPTSPLPGEVLAAEWFTHRKRGLLAPFGVGTVDQVLLSVLHTRHYFVRLFGLSHKTVIVDEVHAYDAYMVKLLERLLEWLAALRCSVVMLSATLPRKRRWALMAAYAQGLRLPCPTFLEDAYPRLSWLTPSDSGTKSFEVSPRFCRQIRLEWLPASWDLLGKKLSEMLAAGGCAAVICNTVPRAQEVYTALKPLFSHQGDDGLPELDLFHARCLFGAREARELRTLGRFGRAGTGAKRPRQAVLVATQVIEQSLDLDFDLMVTDMAPVDLLLQRAGRLHRHARPRRPEQLREQPTLMILLPEPEGPLPRFDPGTERVYHPHLLLRTWCILRNRQSIAVPDDVEELIEGVYGNGPPPADLPPEIAQAWRETREDLERQQAEEESQARYRYILPPCYPDHLWEAHHPELEEDDPAVHRSLQAVTRWGDPSVSLVFLYEREGEVFLDLQAKQPVSLDDKPGGDLLRALLRRSVSISHGGLTPWLLKNGETPAGWRRHPLLCRHRLIRLDAQGRWQGGGWELSLDEELGVVISSQKKEGVCSHTSI